MGPFVAAGSERARRAMLNEGHSTNRKGPRYKATVTSVHRGAIRRQRIKAALFNRVELVPSLALCLVNALSCSLQDGAALMNLRFVGQFSPLSPHP